MKMILAIVQPKKLNKIKKLLYENNITRFFVEDCYGHSDEDSIIETYRGIEMEIDLKKKIKIHIAVNDDFVDKAVQAILKGGRSGKIGDGKIFVLPIENCYRIATGEEGSGSIN